MRFCDTEGEREREGGEGETAVLALGVDAGAAVVGVRSMLESNFWMKGDELREGLLLGGDARGLGREVCGDAKGD
jgi:hypothetical protein